MKKQLNVLLLVSLVIQACQSSIAIPKSDGSFEIRSKGSTNYNALQAALGGASDNCKKQGRSYVVDNQSILYKGALDEQSKNVINQVSNVASTAAFFASAVGGNSAMIVPENPASTAEDYEAVLQIRCQ